MQQLSISNHSKRHSRRSGIYYGFLALLIWLPLPLGTKHPWAISIASSWCYILAAIIVFQLIRQQKALPDAIHAAKFAIFLLTINLAWLIFQCIPIPVTWLHILSPSAATLYLQSGNHFAPISLDASVTQTQAQTAAYLLTLFCLTIYLVDSRKKLTWLVYCILISALFQVIYGAMNILTGTEYSFFISKADLHSHIGSATGTFTNRDHLAGYLEMSLALGVGYMLTLLSDQTGPHHWKSRIRQLSALMLGPKARLRILLILLCLGLVLTHSRGGNIAFFSSLGISGAFFLLFARKKPRATVLFLISLIVLDIIIIGSWVGLSKVLQRLEHTTTITESRDDAYLATLPMIKDYIITGVGAGNYFNAFPAYKTPVLPGYWNHAHNDYLEFLAEQGLIGTSLLAGLVLYTLWTILQIFRHRRSQFILGLSFSSLMGIVAILTHSAFDFNLQIVANSSLFMVVLAIPFICRNLKTQ